MGLELLVTSPFYFAFLILVRVCHELDFHFILIIKKWSDVGDLSGSGAVNLFSFNEKIIFWILFVLCYFHYSSLLHLNLSLPVFPRGWFSFRFPLGFSPAPSPSVSLVSHIRCSIPRQETMPRSSSLLSARFSTSRSLPRFHTCVFCWFEFLPPGGRSCSQIRAKLRCLYPVTVHRSDRLCRCRDTDPAHDFGRLWIEPQLTYPTSSLDLPPISSRFPGPRPCFSFCHCWSVLRPTLAVIFAARHRQLFGVPRWVSRWQHTRFAYVFCADSGTPTLRISLPGFWFLHGHASLDFSLPTRSSKLGLRFQVLATRHSSRSCSVRARISPDFRCRVQIVGALWFWFSCSPSRSCLFSSCSCSDFTFDLVVLSCGYHMFDEMLAGQ
jgi:hypothetical protein